MRFLVLLAWVLSGGGWCDQKKTADGEAPSAVQRVGEEEPAVTTEARGGALVSDAGPSEPAVVPGSDDTADIEVPQPILE